MTTTALIPISGSRGWGRRAVVDPEMADLVGRFRWHLTRDGYVATNRGHAMRALLGDGPRMVTIHRLVLGLTGWHEGAGIDHVNMDRLDNRRSNLRVATQSQNTANMSARSLSGYKGVVRRHGRWVARITVHRRQHHLGRFDTIEQAAHAYDDAARSHFGGFARLNFPGPGEQSALGER